MYHSFKQLKHCLAPAIRTFSLSTFAINLTPYFMCDTLSVIQAYTHNQYTCIDHLYTNNIRTEHRNETQTVKN